MNRNHLDKILKSVYGHLYTPAFLDRLYEPEYYSQPIDEFRLNRYCENLLTFEYKDFGFVFIDGSISCSGVILNFKSERFNRIMVSVFYDVNKMTCYNSVLAVPKYTHNDYVGRKSISHRGHTIRSGKQLKTYIKKLYCLFECPIIAE